MKNRVAISCLLGLLSAFVLSFYKMISVANDIGAMTSPALAEGRVVGLKLFVIESSDGGTFVMRQSIGQVVLLVTMICIWYCFLSALPRQRFPWQRESQAGL